MSPCDAVEQCESGLLCTQNGFCVSGSVGDSCASNDECLYNNCGQYTPVCGGLGASCSSDNECAGLGCGSGQCGGIGASCAYTWPGFCVGSYCNTVSNVCSTGQTGE